MKGRTEQITAIILAGGKSSRMGSEKGLIPYQGSPFVRHIISAVEPLADHILIVTDNPAYNEFGFERIEDRFKERGPLSGLYSGLEASSTAYNIVLSCDIPLITSELLRKLLDGKKEEADIVHLKVSGKVMPLIALYHKRCSATCEFLLNKNERRLLALRDHHTVIDIEIPDELTYQGMNINTKDELIRFNHEHNH